MAAAEQTFAESLAERGLPKSETRADHSGRVLDADAAMGDAAADLSNVVCLELEGRYDNPGNRAPVPELLALYESRRREYDETVRAAMAFLKEEGRIEARFPTNEEET